MPSDFFNSPYFGLSIAIAFLVIYRWVWPPLNKACESWRVKRLSPDDFETDPMLASIHAVLLESNKKQQESIEAMELVVASVIRVDERTEKDQAGRLIEFFAGAQKRMEEQLSEQHAAMVREIQRLGVDLERSHAAQVRLYQTMFNGAGYQNMDDEGAALEEKIETYVRRYGMNREEARSMARGELPYQVHQNSSGGMRSKS